MVSKKSFAWVFGLSFFALALPAKAHAAFLIDSILGWAVGWVIFVINYIIAAIFGVAVSIISYFISIILQLNTNIVGSLIVTSGFQITLSIANLGFVLAIIVIGIMTILRYQPYALKQTLWKLVAAAILVNFSLVIAGAILNFSDQLTTYLMDSFNPAGSGSSVMSFSSSIAGAFQPQRIFLQGNGVNGSTTASISAAQGNGQDFGGILSIILNIFFPTLFLIIVVIALSGLFIMLLIRYVYIAILLILMPMAWLLWIFPVTSGQWHKWWSKFIQWTMFAPVVMFFLYLAIMTGGYANGQQSTVGGGNFFIQGKIFTSDSTNPIVASISNVVGNTFSGMLGTLLQMTVMVSLVFAGLFMAQSMGVTFADTTLKGMKGITSGFGGFVKRRAVIGAGWGMNKAKIPKAAEFLQKGVGAKPTKLWQKALKYTGIEYAGQKLGEGVTAVHVATREGTVDEAEKRLAPFKKRELIQLFPGATNPERIVIMKRAAKEGYIKDLDLKNYLKKDLLQAYHIEIPTYKDISEGKGAILTEEMIQALVSGDQNALDRETERVATSTTKAKIGSNDNLGDMYGSFKDPNDNDPTKHPSAQKIGFGGLNELETNKWLESLTKNIVTKNFSLVSSMIPKMNSNERKNFEKMFNKVIADLRATGNADADKYEENYRKIISSNTLGYAQPDAAAPAGGAQPAAVAGPAGGTNP